jgi:nitrogenase-stabilizing/protective protein
MTAIPKTLAQFNQLKTAEEYFEFFGLDYDSKVVSVNRLHILQKFSQLIREIDSNQPEQQIIEDYRQALQTAYCVFLTSTSVEQKLFKVFQDRPKNVVMLSEIEAE